MATLEQINNHVLFIDLSDLKIILEDLLSDEDFIANLDERSTELINRTKLVIDYIDNNLNSADSMLLRETHLTNIRAQIINIKNWLGNKEFFNNEQNRINLDNT
ncbi:hypothetical protein ACM5ME_21150 [Bacillus subtilis]|uniref:hypothetical protein n=2 Tax=Bacillaceae TaxID=186817 RepID=UPI003AABCB15